MIESITGDAYPYVLESDRASQEEDKTIFFVVPKTVRGAAETAADYIKVSTERKKTGKREIDVPAMQLADDKEWLRAIQKVEHYAIKPNAPEKGYDHFMLQLESRPSEFKKLDDGRILIISTGDKKDLQYIFWSMAPQHTEEIMKAYMEFNELKEGLKNV